MKPIHSQILNFIDEHHVLTLATESNNQPYCSTCFYVFDRAITGFYFTSELNTKHAADMLKNPMVSAAIALETKITGKIRGLQIMGIVEMLKNEELKTARKKYIRKFPVATLSKLNLWILQPQWIKMTDNRLGFGKKLVWSVNE